jgi:choline/glycine/proline betaine transport protein
VNDPTPTARGVLHRIGLLRPASAIALAVLLPFLALSLLSIETASALVIGAKDWVVGRFDWLFVGVASAALLLVVTLGVHPRANVRLGAKDAEPEFPRLAWFAMLFSAGLASGLLYWATAEPVLHFQQNPFLERAGIASSSAAAAMPALRITIFHWGLHGWAFYVLGALAIGVYSYRHGQALSFRTALYPLLGPRWIDRWPGLAVDGVALLGTVCGVATSIGLAAAGMNATLHALFGLEVGLAHQLAIVAGVCALGVASALSGVGRGIRRLSELNVWVSGVLLVALGILGPTAVLWSLFAGALVDYVREFASLGLWVADGSAGRRWQAAWTVFYWGWWLAWMPFVSLFIARISRGRSVREFVLGVMLVPTLVIIAWMAVFGGTALHQELAVPGSVSAAVNRDYSLGTVTVIENLGQPGWTLPLIAIAAFLLFTWLITSLDSATLVIAHMLGAPEIAGAKVLWGVVLAAVTGALMGVGGVSALQAASIIIGLPLAAVAIAVGVGLARDLLFRRL